MTVSEYVNSKSDLIAKYGIHESDSGSVFVQIALLTERITYLHKHTLENKKDNSAKRSFLKMINKRRKMIKSLDSSDSKVPPFLESLGLKLKNTKSN